MNDKQQQENLVRTRFFILHAVRFSGGIMAALGIGVIANGAFDLPVEVGYILFAVGIFAFIAMPVILSRRWKDPKEL